MALVPQPLETSLSRAVDNGVSVLARSNISPNFISALAFVLSLIAAWLLFGGQFVFAGILILFAGVLDMADGKLARLTKQESVFGAIFDATLDRIGELAIYSGIGAYLIKHALYLCTGIAVIALGGSLLVSYVRARSESYHISCQVGLLRRGERIFLIGMGAALNAFARPFHALFHSVGGLLHLHYSSAPVPLTLSIIVIAVLTPVTIVQRLMYIRTRELTLRNS